MDRVNQYEVVMVNLDPTIGSEMKKTRPCVVVSPDEMNRHLQTIVIAPITSARKPYPTRVEISIKQLQGSIAIDQIRTIDRRRIIRTLALLDPATILAIKQVIKETFVD
jgi:mRNA interferase MazF